MDIKDIRIKFEGDGLTKYGLFALLAWFLKEIIELEKRCKIVTVKRKRNRDKERNIKRRKSAFPSQKMCVGIVASILLGIKRFERINNLLHDEVRVANLVGLERFFDCTTARNFINSFQSWHLSQLDHVNTDILRDFGESFRQDFPVIDVDMTTHSLESKKREGAVPGYNKKNKGKPCYQWSVGFIRDEIVSQILSKGNTHCSAKFKDIVEDVKKKLGGKNIIIRADGGYLSGEMLNYVVEEDLQVIVVSQFDYITAQKENKIDWSKWLEYDKDTRLLDAGEANVVSKCNHKFRVILVEKKQEKIKIKKRKEYIYYAIVSRLNNPSDSSAIYEFYHQRQTIENFFKESKNPFNSSKMPSQKFRANEAYLNLITIAYNCFGIFKKTICQKSGRENLLVQLRIS
ncbi:hypothetical protein MSIBF_A2780003 [groundwater metagenome]|uniref:Transposase DDE domain-containing protein n=1 Tax=groundwater metagenome TaxID=717931 RepID=A0A098EBG1_9ZZZZ